MKKKTAITSFVLIIVFALLSAFLSFFSFRIPFTNYRWNSFVRGMNFGGDISDGICSKYSISYSGENVNAKDEMRKKVYDLLNDYYTQPNVYVEDGSNLYVEIGSEKNYANDERIENCLAYIGTKTEFEVKDSLELYDKITIANVKSAYLRQVAGTSALVIQLDDVGTELLRSISQAGMVIQISSDNVIQSTSNDEITDGKIYINWGNRAGIVATIINLECEKSGVTLTYNETKNLTATFGDRVAFVFLISIVAISVCFIILFAVRFRLLGVFAIFPFVIFVGIYTFFLNTLPGMQVNAGGLIAIAVSVILCLVTFFAFLQESKKQFREGKSAVNSAKFAFSKIMKNVLDFSFVLAVPLIVLIFLGSASINNFAVCLLVGLATGIFISLVVFRAGINSVIKIFEKNLGFVGLNKKEEAKDE